MSAGLQIAIAIISPVAAIAAAVIALMRVLGRLERRLDHIEIISATVENQNRALLTAFPSVISSLTPRLSGRPRMFAISSRAHAGPLEPWVRPSHRVVRS